MALTTDQVLGRVPTELLINGNWVPASDGGTFEVVNPATGEAMISVASASQEDGVAAVAAAHQHQAEWAATAPHARAECLRSAFLALNQRADEFSHLITLEMGKPLAEARGEVLYGAEFFRWFSPETLRVHGRYAIAPDGNSRLMTMKQPVGPTLMITPWNFPLAMGTRKIGPAIAAGCTMVIKPASSTPLTMLQLGKLLQEAGVPKGVINIIPSRQSNAVIGAILKDDRLRKITFTGSTEVGRHLIREAAENILRTSMELGGNAPFIVFEDADIDLAVDEAMKAKMRNMGEACTAANRFLVHESVIDQFSRKFAAAMSMLSMGDGLEDGSQVGPMIDAKARSKVEELVSDAVAQGGELLTGGEIPDGSGYFYPPTLISRVPADARILDEEIFGPVAPIVAFSNDEEAIRLANDTVYGLAAYIMTKSMTRALTISEALEYGMVGVNQGVISNPAAPFGGIKHSGVGREGGFEGIDEYLETKYVGLKL